VGAVLSECPDVHDDPRERRMGEVPEVIYFDALIFLEREGNG
jgi:hypothetical protein